LRLWTSRQISGSAKFATARLVEIILELIFFEAKKQEMRDQNVDPQLQYRVSL